MQTRPMTRPMRLLTTLAALVALVVYALCPSPPLDGLPFAFGAVTTATTLTEVIRQAAYAKSVLYFSAKLGLSDFVAFKDLTGEDTLTARFPIYDLVDALAIAEATDFTTTATIDTTGSVDVTVAEHQIRFDVTDLSIGATVDDIADPPDAVRAKGASEGGIAGQMAAEAVQRLQDKDISALFSAFDSSTGSNTGALTTTLFLDAIRILNTNNIPESPRIAVLNPRQWSALLPALDDAAVYGAQGQEIVATGVVGRIYGVDVFMTNNVGTATVSTSTVHAGAIMHPSAIAVAQKGSLDGSLAAQRDESSRLTELHKVGVWGEAEYRGGATTNGRGGAGVFLYSNSTA